ncbi:hypothetical protein FQN50_001624 [Emmonsiellopsis sp. PD_5]|nr:hypothetical protein FQN50_001624 [Emmonsiellopsis sp. PD_5]
MTSTTSHPPCPTRVRQIALVAQDLERAEYLLTKVIGSEVIFVDAGVELFGLENILVAIGGDILEVVSPIKPNTSAGRLLSKRGDGGYMIIMQNGDAKKQRAHIESKGLGKVIYTHEDENSVCIQYHPKGIKGGMMPELDSHHPTPEFPEPVTSRFSPWHGCGSPYYAFYSACMKRTAELQLAGVTCRLAPGDTDTDAAVQQWAHMFGIPRGDDGCLEFTNVRMKFVPGREGMSEGLAAITIAVKGEERLRGIFDRAAEMGLPRGDGWVDMVGVRWWFVLGDGKGDAESKL